MVAPVTGPFRFYGSTAGILKERTWFRQRKPFNLPLPFDSFDIQAKFRSTDPDGYNGPWNPVGRPTFLNLIADQHNLYAPAYAVAYDRFASSIKGGLQASLGMMIAEAGESFAMITSRVLAMTRFVKALKRGRFGEAYDALVDNNRTFKQQARLKKHMGTRRYQALPWSDALLEVSFGWTPLLSDIHSAVEVLSKAPDPIPSKFKGTGKTVWQESGRRAEDSVSWVIDSGFVAFKVTVAGMASVDNPNIALANQLGLVNPVSVAWDAIPLSYLINWFVPLKQYLESYSTFWGYSVTNTRITTFRSGWSSQDSLYKPWNKYSQFEDNGWYLSRVVSPLTIPSLSSRIKLPGGQGALGKIATSCAVLIQQLSNRK